MNERIVKLKASCIHLRHKAMYSDQSQDVRGFVDETIDTIPFFCLLTCDCLGPDNDSAGPAECRPGRGCFCASDEPEAKPT